MELCTAPPPGSTVICADELGPVIPRTFPPAPGWSPGGHRVKAPPGYSRDPEKTWVYGGLRIEDGQALTLCAPSRNSEYYQRVLHSADSITRRESVGGVETTFERRVCDGIVGARSSRVVSALALVAEHRLVMNERVTSPLLSPSP